MARKKKQKRTVTRGIINIHTTFNNTIVNIRKSTPYAAQLAAQRALRRAINEFGLQEAEIRVKGPGAGRESALRAVFASGIRVTAIRDDRTLG